MQYDETKVDEIVLALLYLGMFKEGRSWKSFDWASLNRLHASGFISNPISNAKSVVLTQEGIEKSEKLFKHFFVKENKVEIL